MQYISPDFNSKVKYNSFPNKTESIKKCTILKEKSLSGWLAPIRPSISDNLKDPSIHVWKGTPRARMPCMHLFVLSKCLECRYGESSFAFPRLISGVSSSFNTEFEIKQVLVFYSIDLITKPIKKVVIKRGKFCNIA